MVTPYVWPICGIFRNPEKRRIFACFGDWSGNWWKNAFFIDFWAIGQDCSKTAKNTLFYRGFLHDLSPPDRIWVRFDRNRSIFDGFSKSKGITLGSLKIVDFDENRRKKRKCQMCNFRYFSTPPYVEPLRAPEKTAKMVFIQFWAIIYPSSKTFGFLA